jgi:TusA-related sulfurtransferase
MSTAPLPSSVWNLPTSLPQDLAAMEKNVAQFKESLISPTQFQVFRVPQGVYEQRESGAYMLRVRLPAGVALPHQLRKLADVAEQYGDGILHVTTRQDIQVHRVALASIHPALVSLAEANLSSKGGGGNTVRNITGCPHAGVCANEAFDTTPHALGLTEFLLNDPQSFQLPRKYKIAFSGCREDCAGGTVNDVGFLAKVRDGVEGFAVYAGGGLGSSGRVDGRLVPHYVLQFGGHVEEGKTQLAAGRHAIPAPHVPDFLLELLDAYEKSTQKPDFSAFLRAASANYLDTLIAKYKPVPAFAEDKNFYYDWGATEPFSLAGRGPGECGAGVLDLIEVDLKSADEALQEGNFYSAAALASRALLVTRGEQASSDREAFELFEKHFIQAGLVEGRFQPLVTLGTRAANSPYSAAIFAVPEVEVRTFVGAIQSLFQSMDATLQFSKRFAGPTATASGAPAEAPATPLAEKRADLEKDFRGVVCPLNYVKTKMALDQLKPGQLLAVLLDDQGATNVPESAAKDGHEVLSITPEGKDTRIIIRKKAKVSLRKNL